MDSRSKGNEGERERAMNERARAFEVERAKSFGVRRREGGSISLAGRITAQLEKMPRGREARVKGTLTEASPSLLQPNLVPNLKYHTDSHGH